MSEQLKPCPFCGGEPEMKDHRLSWAVSCRCGAFIEGERAPEPESDMTIDYWSGFYKSAVDKWNNRPAEPEWLPIETAPKDGTAIIGCEKGMDKGHEMVFIHGDWVEPNEEYHEYEPTHWQPMPEAQKKP